MKSKIKNILARLQIFPALDFIRHLPEIMGWLRKGSCGIAPLPYKRMVIRSYLERYQLGCFIETGTHLGDTLSYIAMNRSVQAFSIELADGYYEAATKRFARYPNVELFHGDSGKLMPKVISSLSKPALFWLDGHYSGGLTAKGEVDTPVSAELQSIFQSPVAGHVVLIDDVRCFDGSNDYPHLDEILAVIRHDGRYHVEISADIMRLTPKLHAEPA